MDVSEIQINYEELETTVRTMQARTERLEAMYRQLQNMLEQLRTSGFVGRGANAFYGEMDTQVMPSFKNLCLYMGEGCETLIQVSTIFDAAEAEARQQVEFAEPS